MRTTTSPEIEDFWLANESFALVNAAKDERIDTLESQVDSLGLADLDNVEIRDEGSADEGTSLDGLWMLGKLVDQNHQRAKEALSAVEEVDGPAPEDIAQNEEAARQIAQIPGERLTMMSEDVYENINQKRARFLLTDLKRYAQKAKDGWFLIQEPSVRSSTRVNKPLHRSTIKRLLVSVTVLISSVTTRS